MSSRPLKAAITMAIAGALSLTAAPAQAAPEPDPFVWVDLVPTYTTTAKYSYEPLAPPDGWAATGGCVPEMGYRYVNAEYLADSVVDPGKPEVLLYEGGSDTSDRDLVAVGWAVKNTGQAAPELFGETFRSTEVPGYYTLHAWIYEDNPDGFFEPFNPAVQCASASTPATTTTTATVPDWVSSLDNLDWTA
ncbi:hypothetical protein OG864_22860 [Streptomyces sp. NBC_00124]|uniref:hypothetical protein n=1 Tax=Streptomyces sp. NBC_00124 TaxID=2975662 RepID=UPI0022518373|nr:hypothetical protein [Streptomyces sp. NBC_00124]MCX5361552.1 hypothetical protein [Streptomyces sp. NBC_00124]